MTDVFRAKARTFWFAARFLPADRRHAVAGLYAFARAVDDLVDEPPPALLPDDVLAQLAAWRGWLELPTLLAPPDPALAARVTPAPVAHGVPSPDQRIVDAARADLVFHARLLDALGLDMRHKIVLHVGGAYSDKAAALARWSAAFLRLPQQVLARLILENDERLFGAEDVLGASAASGVPVVLDVLHDRVYAGPDADESLPELLRKAARTWQLAHAGTPKIHYSTQATGLRPGAHAEYVDPAEFARFLDLAPDEVEFDCMLEAKAKDLALFRVRHALGIAA